MATEREQLLREKLLLPSGPVDRDKATPEQLREYELLQRQLAGDKSLIEIDKIKVDKHGRFRKDLGDIADLVESVRTIGLLHPIVVDSQRNLIAGERRLAACKRLGWPNVPARTIDLDEGQLLRAQQDENTVRKNFTPTEMVAIKRAIEDRVRTPAGRRPKETGRSLPSSPGKTIDKVAAVVGTSPENLRKAEAVVVAAEADPELAPVAEEMDRTGKVDPAYKKVKEATAHPAVGGLDMGKLFDARYRENREPPAIFARVLFDLSNAADMLHNNSYHDFSSVTATPGQIKVLTHVIRTLTQLRKTVSKNATEAEKATEPAAAAAPHDDDAKQRLVCDECGASFDEDEVDSPLYECGACGTRYTREGSADGGSSRCPDCNRFGAKVAD